METEDALRGRISADAFDPDRRIDAESIRDLIALACRSPSTLNLQHWRFVLVVDRESISDLAALSTDNRRLENAAAVVIVLGDLRAHEDLNEVLELNVEKGKLEPEQSKQWLEMASQIGSEPRRAREEAIRSSSMAAMALMLAATDRDLASFSSSSVDADGVRERFAIPNRYLVTTLVALGHPAPGRPQHQLVRRDLGQVLVEGGGEELQD